MVCTPFPVSNDLFARIDILPTDEFDLTASSMNNCIHILRLNLSSSSPSTPAPASVLGNSSLTTKCHSCSSASNPSLLLLPIPQRNTYLLIGLKQKVANHASNSGRKYICRSMLWRSMFYGSA